MNLSSKELLLINQYVQGVKSINEIESWFSSVDEKNKKEIVQNIWLLATQAQITEVDIPIAMVAAGLKPTHTPVVMLSTGQDHFIIEDLN